MHDLDIQLDISGFSTRLLGELAEQLERVVGYDEAAGFVSLVGQSMGRHIFEKYVQALGRSKLTREETAQVLVDLKARIDGEFSVESCTDDAIVLVNSRCPFGEHAEGRPSLCMMTSNVFGRIAAKHDGYARVEIDEAIAMGHGRCRVVVHLVPSAQAAPLGREYFDG